MRNAWIECRIQDEISVTMIRSSSTRSNVKEQDIANRKNRRVLVFGVKRQEEKELLRVRRRVCLEIRFGDENALI
ncbi:hypothetical protein AAC387_Pa03g4548 [Persea americana]